MQLHFNLPKYFRSRDFLQIHQQTKFWQEGRDKSVTEKEIKKKADVFYGWSPTYLPMGPMV